MRNNEEFIRKYCSVAEYEEMLEVVCSPDKKKSVVFAQPKPKQAKSKAKTAAAVETDAI